MISRIFGLLLIAASYSVYGDLIDHLKAVPNKSDRHTMPGIDFIYMINLDQRPEKWELSKNQLAPYGIEPYRFSAVNGWELSLEQINDIGLKYTPIMKGDFMGTSYHLDENFEPSHELINNYGQSYYCHCMARGTIGIALSHISLLNDAFESGYETIWITEDDIEVLKDPRILSNEEVGQGNWDILFTDQDIRDSEGVHRGTCGAARRPDFDVYATGNNYAENKRISDTFRKIGARFGTASMIIRRSGIKKLLQFYFNHGIFLPYDLEMVLPKGIKLYTVYDDVVSNLPKASSDNGGANYLNNF
jgi:GR25 family glycosyltransferase involved in LPS biosynthesis